MVLCPNGAQITIFWTWSLATQQMDRFDSDHSDDFFDFAGLSIGAKSANFGSGISKAKIRYLLEGRVFLNGNSTQFTNLGQGRGVEPGIPHFFEIISVLEFVMSKCTTKVALRGILAITMAVGLQTIFASASVGNGSGLFQEETGQPRLATHESAGEIHFALSIAPKITPAQRSSDIVVYVDTSASQTGAFKRDSIEVVKQLLKNLNAEDRVQIVAVDLDPVPMTTGFVNPGSNEATVALGKLSQRVSLGSTDIEAMLVAAGKSFDENTNRNKNVIYVGDAISRENLLGSEEFVQIVTDLADKRISVSSFAIGPERNIELLAALANNTGGNFVVDNDADESVRQSAIALANTVHNSVFWPTSGSLDESIVEIFPYRFPPLRTDRDTIILGTLADREAVELNMVGKMNGQDTEMNWSLTPEANSIDFAFLTGVVRESRKDKGFSLPTVGSEGLREYVLARSFKAHELSELGGQALAMGNKDAARKLAGAALAADPASANADLLAMASTYKVQEGDPFGGADAGGQDGGGDIFGAAGDTQNGADDIFGAAPAGGDANLIGDAAPAEAPAAQDPFAAQAEDMTQEPPTEDVFGSEPAVVEPVVTPEANIVPGQEQPGMIPVTDPVPMDIATPAQTEGLSLVNPNYGDRVDDFLRDSDGRSNSIITSEEDRIKIINQRTRQQVQIELTSAREELKYNPDAAIERLKNVLEIVDQTSDLYPSTRADLRNSLESSLLSSRRRKLDFDNRQQMANINIATANSVQIQSDRLARRNEEISRWVNNFNSLIDERNYESAVQVTQSALDVATDDPDVVVARENARIIMNYNRLTELRDLKARNFAASMYEIEKITVPFPGDQIMVFGDADEWKAKKLRRAKYRNLRLSGSENDEKILRALEETANFNFDEQAWSEVEEELEKEYGINIVLTTSAKDDSLTEDDLVSSTLSGIRFKNALRLMLAERNATFVVKDEVLMIISKDDEYAEEYTAPPNVYNVGDLVAPRFNPGGGIGGGGGGGLGGGQGGGGGGQQGGGGGGRGGGGVFCVQESGQVSLNLGAGTSKPATGNKKPVVIKPATTWTEHFANTFADPADVRATARELMKTRQSSEVVSMILAAIQNDQLQPWMYEGLVLSMQISGAPQSEIERALMSAVDVSNDDNDTLYAAGYMLENGMQKRAIRLLKSFARSNPVRTEPYVLGLRAAQQIKDAEGIQWATIGIFSQEWPEHPEVVKQARYAATAMKTQLKTEGRTNELAAYESKLKEALERDCFIDVSWAGDADLDVYVVEPGGTVCSRLAKRTSAGGVSMGDRFSKKAGLSGQISEQYVLPKGFAGDYRVMIRRIWGEVPSGKVTVSIHNHYRSDRESSMTKQVKIDDKGAMVLFSLDQGRRTEPLEDHEIRTAVKQQLATNKFVLAQQLESGGSSSSQSGYYGSQLGAGENGGGGNQLAGLGDNRRLTPGVTGYQPVITQIPEGTFFTVNHATTSDRLYVMVSVSPLFSQITEVSTFNIFGDANTAQGLAGGAGGGAGGGGAGGGGAGGGGAGGGGVF